MNTLFVWKKLHFDFDFLKDKAEEIIYSHVLLSAGASISSSSNDC